MKKLLTLFVVLALAVPAFATPLPISPSGMYFDVFIVPEGMVDPIDWDGGDVAPSDIIIIELWTVEPMTGHLPTTYTSISNAGEPWELIFEPGVFFMAGSDFYLPSENPTVPPVPGSTDLFVNAMHLGTPVGRLWTLAFHVPWDKPPSEWIWVDPYAGTWNYWQAMPDDPGLIIEGMEWGEDGLPVVAFHVIPEPMTIALLGLGGLFLVRRKRK